MDNSSPPSKRRRNAFPDTLEDEPAAFLYTGQPEKDIPKNITHVAFGPFVTEITDWAFTNCNLLQTIEIPAAVKTIGVEAFSRCDSLTNVRCEGLQSIGRSAFFECRAIETVELNHGLESIGGGAFEECESLRTLSVPSTVETIGDDAFQDCISLTSVSFQESNMMKSIGRRAFCRCEALEHIELPKGLKEISFCVFAGCDELKAASIPDTVETIDASAFDSCRALVEVDLGQGLESIGARAFARCISLSAVALPPAIQIVKCHAFKGCTSLLGVEIPTTGTIITISAGSFDDCTSLINVSVPNSVDDDISNNAFSGCVLLEKCGLGKKDEELDPIACLRERFSKLTVHNACYNSSTNTVDGLSKIMDESTNTMGGENLEDSFGLTPLHIVATSSNLREDVFEWLLGRYPVEILWHHDKYGKTAVDYLLAHTTSNNKALPLLHAAFRRSMSGWGLPKWRNELERRSGSTIPNVNDTAARNEHVRGIFRYLGYYTRVELTSLLEQALWKGRMIGGALKGDTESDQVHRENCQLQCGSEVVIENVVEYLWKGESKPDTALSTFPLCAEWK